MMPVCWYGIGVGTKAKTEAVEVEVVVKTAVDGKTGAAADAENARVRGVRNA